LTLHADNLPETGKRQHENKARRLGAIMSMRRETKGKIPSLCFPSNEMRRAPTQCSIGNPLQLFELARAGAGCAAFAGRNAGHSPRAAAGQLNCRAFPRLRL